MLRLCAAPPHSRKPAWTLLPGPVRKTSFRAASLVLSVLNWIWTGSLLAWLLGTGFSEPGQGVRYGVFVWFGLFCLVFFSFLSFADRLSCSPGCSGIYYVAKDGLEFHLTSGFLPGAGITGVQSH